VNFTPKDLMNCWNGNRGDMRICLGLDVGKRQVAAVEALKREPDLRVWAAAIKRASASLFLTGMVPGANGVTFIGHFDWLLRPDTLTLIQEGQFDGPKEHEAPMPKAPEVTEYWNRPKPSVSFSDEEFLRCQIQGRLVLVREREKKRKTGYDDFCRAWLEKGGEHPWATEEQVAEATAYVEKARAKKTLPASYGAFKRGLDSEMQRFSRENPRKALPNDWEPKTDWKTWSAERDGRKS
jgi:hypothetical protein